MPYELPDPVTGDPTTVSEKTWKASQPGAVFNSGPDYLQHNMGYDTPRGALRAFHPRNIGSKLRGAAMHGDKSILGDIANMGPTAGAIGYGVPLGLLGLGVGGLKDYLMGTEGSGKKYGLLASLIGAGLGGYSGYIRNRTRTTGLPVTPMPEKTAGYRMPGGQQGPKEEIMRLLKGDASADFQLKSRLMREVQMMDPNRASEVLRVLATVGGGMIAATLAKLLLGTGYASSALIGLGSGTLINQLSQPRDAFGRQSNPGHTMFGQPI